MLRYTIEIHKYYGTLPFVSGMYVPIDIPMHIDIYLPAIESKGPIIYIFEFVKKRECKICNSSLKE